MTRATRNPINEKPQRVWNWLPPRLRDDQNYQELVNFIHQREQYDIFLTINFLYRQPDAVVIQRTSDLLRMTNARLTSRRWRERERYLHGFAFLERHKKDQNREGSLHVHVLGYYPETFYANPTLTKFRSKIEKVSTKIKTQRGSPMISIGEIDVCLPHDAEGLVRYLSKKLTPENLLERTGLLAQDGIVGWTPGLDSSVENMYKPNSLYNSNFEESSVRTIKR